MPSLTRSVELSSAPWPQNALEAEAVEVRMVNVVSHDGEQVYEAAAMLGVVRPDGQASAIRIGTALEPGV